MRLAAAALLALAAAGCAQLLPKSSTEVSSPWRDFASARAAVERIEPGRTGLAELRALGIDPYSSPNVQLLTYSDIVTRFPVQVGVEKLDAGLRECLEAGNRCTGYYLNVKDVKRDRTGSFWLDALGFKRVTETSGWNFNALVLVVGDRAVYTLYGGQPQMHEQEVNRQPLGPFQSFGDWGTVIK